jgi:hypothetical protein
MSDTERFRKVIDVLMPSWPEELAVDITDIKSVTYEHHPLVHELRALDENQSCTLPFFTASKVDWITLAPNTNKLRRASDLIRSWLIPSYAWEHEDNPFVRPDQVPNDSALLFLKVSPEGYYRWVCKKQDFGPVLNRLKSMRVLLSKKPNLTRARRRPLSALRQQFSLALALGDQDGAQEIITDIDSRKLDTASNTSIMKIRMWGHFKEFGKILAPERNLENLISLPLPITIRCQIVEALHVVHLRNLEEEEGIETALEKYKNELHSKFGGLIVLCTIQNNVSVARMICYNAVVRCQSIHLDSAPNEIRNDLIVHDLVEKSLKIKSKNVVVPAAFWIALEDNNWNLAQVLGIELLESDAVNDNIKSFIKSTLSKTLDFSPNSEIADLIEASEIVQFAADTLPDNWNSLCDKIVRQEFIAIHDFCENSTRPPISDSNIDDVSKVLNALDQLIEDIITDPELDELIYSNETLEMLLHVVVEELIAHRDFPKKSYSSCYQILLDCWVKFYQGSAGEREGSLVLTLSEGLLEHDASTVSDVLTKLQEWWDARPIPSMLPFLADGLDLILQRSAEVEKLQELWLKGAIVLAGANAKLSPVDYAIWFNTGVQLGLDDGTISSTLGKEPFLDTDTEVDILGTASLKKVAIVSLQKMPAEKAAEIIREKTGAKVIVVIEKVPGAKTNDATDADVILFVWSCSKHAVYRAFDKARDRLAYVKGTGTDSIVRALERFLVKKSNSSSVM